MREHHRGCDANWSRPMITRRLWAAGALACALATVVFAVVVAAGNFPRGLAVLACLILAIAAAAYGLTRRAAARKAGVLAAALLLAGALTLVVVQDGFLEDLLIVVGAAVALDAARRAFKVH